ncbi:MAG: hypothetical protein ABSG91_12825 [Syntrophobacteraceae bacterium]|jgi:hypothetical protein
MKEQKVMSRCFYLFALVSIVSALLLPAFAGAQEYPIMNRVADKVIQKYLNESCEQLWQERGQPKPPMEQEAVQLLQGDPQMRAAFIDKVAAPIANKMFECGMIP